MTDYEAKIKILEAELVRKDKIIEELKEQNTILMRTMLREKEKTTQTHNKLSQVSKK